VSLPNNSAVAGLTLSPLINLEHLTIHTFLAPQTHEGTIITSLPAIVQLLGTASSAKHLSFHLYYQYLNLDFVSDAHWSHLMFLSTLPASIQHTDLLVSGHMTFRDHIHRSKVMSLAANTTIWRTLMNSGLAIGGELHNCRHSRCCCYTR